MQRAALIAGLMFVHMKIGDNHPSERKREGERQGQSEGEREKEKEDKRETTFLSIAFCLNLFLKFPFSWKRRCGPIKTCAYFPKQLISFHLLKKMSFDFSKLKILKTQREPRLNAKHSFRPSISQYTVRLKMQ